MQINRIKKISFTHMDAILTVILALLVIVLPFVLKTDYLIHIGVMIGINILLALGMHLVTGLAGQINMGQYGFYCIGAYSGAILTTTLGLGFWVSLLFTIAISAGFGMLVGVPSLKVEGPYLALCTIGFAESVRLVINSASWAGKANGIMRVPKLEIFGIQMATKTQSFYFVMAVAIFGIVLVNNLNRSNFGKRFAAIKDDSLAASVIGIDVSRIKITAFVLCAIFAGVAGQLYSSYSGYISPATFIQALQTNILLMIVLGGLGNAWGAVIGAALVTIVFEYTRAYVEFQKIAFGIVMIIIVLFLRRGIIGTIKNFIQQKKIVDQHNMERVEASEVKK